VVQEFMGVSDLVMAGSHGFDIWSPEEGTIEPRARSHHNPERDRYEIDGVTGPDEFHEKYAGAEEGGLKNNAYTNVTVAWISKTVLEVLVHRARRCARRDRSGELVGAVPGRARERRRGRAGRDHQGGHPRGGHVGHPWT
jgi:hypothetical protein